MSKYKFGNAKKQEWDKNLEGNNIPAPVSTPSTTISTSPASITPTTTTGESTASVHSPNVALPTSESGPFIAATNVGMTGQSLPAAHETGPPAPSTASVPLNPGPDITASTVAAATAE
ncbi:hypothetical protein FRC11_014070 [Ceratobasidium sp. 423]|nr:hypothetical protein FRC11_014070 [Ceratobasidium sp. 423]